MSPMPTSPTPKVPSEPTTAPGGVLGGTWTAERRVLLGAGLGLLCLGIIFGFRMAKGGQALIEEARRTEGLAFPPKVGPCADCAEREIQRQRAAARQPDRPLPGNVPPPPAPGDPVVSPESSGMMTDTSKGSVMDPTFAYGGGDASSVPGMA